MSSADTTAHGEVLGLRAQSEESVLSRLVAKVLGNVANGGLTFLQQLLLGKVLGPVQFGSFTFIQNHFESIFNFSDCGVSRSVFSLISQDRQRYPRLAPVLFVIWLFMIAAAGVYVLLIRGLHWEARVWPDIDPRLMGAGLLFASGVWFSRSAVFLMDAAGVARAAELMRSTRALVGVGIVALFFFVLPGLSGIFLAMSLPYLVFIALVLFRAHQRMGAPAFQWDAPTLKSSTLEIGHYWHPLVVSGVFGIATTLFERWFLQIAGGSIEQGYFGLGLAFSTGIFLVAQSYTPILLRECAVAFGERNPARIRTLYTESLRRFFPLVAAPCIFLSFHFREIMALSFLHEFEAGWLTFALFAIYPIHQATGHLSVAVQFATNSTRSYARISILRDGIGVLLVILLIAPSDLVPFSLGLNSSGLAIKLLACQSLNTILIYYANSRSLDIKLSSILLREVRVLATLVALTAFCYFLTAGLHISIPMTVVLSFLLWAGALFLMLFARPTLLGISEREVSEALRLLSLWKRK